jgi:hypothetical protein
MCWEDKIFGRQLSLAHLFFARESSPLCGKKGSEREANAPAATPAHLASGPEGWSRALSFLLQRGPHEQRHPTRLVFWLGQPISCFFAQKTAEVK